jgi:hypothetical protein
MANEKFFNQPNVPPPERDSEFEYNAQEERLIPPDISEETILETTPAKNIITESLKFVSQLRTKSANLILKTQGTLSYHLTDMDYSGPIPSHIQKAIEELVGPVDILTPQHMECITSISQRNPRSQVIADTLNQSTPQDTNNDLLFYLLEKMTKNKYSYGTELLWRLVRLCLAYAVHMIIGGLCNFFLGKLSIPIPFLGTFPAGTMISQTILAPAERTAKRALGFPCEDKLPLPNDCLNLFRFLKDDDDPANLLPCCMPVGLSAMLLRMQEIQQRASGGNPLSSNIDDFLKSFKIEGGFKQGYIKTGSTVNLINSEVASILAEGDPNNLGASMKNAVARTAAELKTSNKQQQQLLTTLDERAILGSAAQGLVDSWFSCVAQGLSAALHDEPDNLYQGPPCVDPSNPVNSSELHIDYAKQVIDFYVQKNSVPDKPNITNSVNVKNLIGVLSSTKDTDYTLAQLERELKDHEDVLNPSTKRCIEGLANLRSQNTLDLKKIANDPKAFFDKLGTDNSMSNISLTPEASTEISGFDIGDTLATNIGNIGGLQSIGSMMQNVLDGVDSLLSELDGYVSSVNGLTKFFSSKEFCCIIYLIVLLSNVARGKGLCPTDDISSFFQYSQRIKDKKDVAILKAQLALLKGIIDAIRQSLAIGIEVKGLNIPLKDLMEQVRTTIATISKVLVDAATAPIEEGLDSILLNPEVNASVQNNCFYAFDILSLLKCGIEWFKIFIVQLAMDLFENNFQNIELVRNLKMGGMRFKILDMLSNLLGAIINLLVGIGDCYDGDDYLNSIVGDTIQQQYSEADRLVSLLNRSNVPIERIDEWSQTLEGSDPLNVDPNSSEAADVFSEFFNVGEALTEKTVQLLRSAAPLSLFIAKGTSGPPKLVDPDEFVRRMEEYTGTSLSQIYLDLYGLDKGIFDIFASGNIPPAGT